MALEDKLAQINKLKSELDALQPLSRENEQKLWKKIRLDWNYNSNHIEGNTLTYGETQLLLMFDKTTGDHELREYEEMKAHDVAIHMVKEWSKDKARDLNENDIRELNKIILVQPFWKEAITFDGQQTRRQIKVGDYKEHPNSVRLKNGEIFEYASPLETPQKMAALIDWYRKNNIGHALILASQLHYDFICIHPFDDGNGRVARLITNYVLMKNDYPPIIVKSNEKEKYLTALNKADVGDTDAFHEYMADQLIWSMELAINAAEGKNIEEKGDLDKKLAMLKMEMADVDVDNEVQINFNKDTFLKIYDTWLSELMKGLILSIRKFDDFFVKPSHHILIKTGLHEGFGGQSVSVSFDDKSETEIITQLKKELIDKAKIISADTEISIHATYGTFKKGALIKPFGCNYHFDVMFDYVKYVIYRRKFIQGADQDPHIGKNIKETLESNKNIERVYFDVHGQGHFNIETNEFGAPFVKKSENGNIPIVISYSRDEILNDRILSGGMEQFAEPRLLHKPLYATEIETLSSEMAETIYNHIDYLTKQIGLR